MITETRGRRPLMEPMSGKSMYDPNAVENVRDLLKDKTEGRAMPAQKRTTPARKRIVMETQEAAPNTPPKGAQKFAELAPAEPTEKQSDHNRPTLVGFRPKAKHIALGVFVLLLLFRPGLVFWTLALTVFTILGLFLVLGYDGFWQTVMKIGRWYARRNPQHAARLHTKLDGFAVKWDMVLDHFPDGTVDGLYMPDFGELATAESRYDAALDRRFADMHKS